MYVRKTKKVSFTTCILFFATATQCKVAQPPPPPFPLWIFEGGTFLFGAIALLQTLSGCSGETDQCVLATAIDQASSKTKRGLLLLPGELLKGTASRQHITSLMVNKYRPPTHVIVL